MTDAIRAGAVDRKTAALSGRNHEQAHIDGLLADTRSGRGGAVTILGEAGSGRTALLDQVVSGRRAVEELSRQPTHPYVLTELAVGKRSRETTVGTVAVQRRSTAPLSAPSVAWSVK